jgi:uncharacterized membrane protein
MGRPRLFTSLAIGFLTFLILSFTRIGVVTAALLGWNVCIVLYLTFAFGLARRSEGEDIRRRAHRAAWRVLPSCRAPFDVRSRR